jgi:hypothetical protein
MPKLGMVSQETNNDVFDLDGSRFVRNAVGDIARRGRDRSQLAVSHTLDVPDALSSIVLADFQQLIAGEIHRPPVLS